MHTGCGCAGPQQEEPRGLQVQRQPNPNPPGRSTSQSEAGAQSADPWAGGSADPGAGGAAQQAQPAGAQANNRLITAERVSDKSFEQMTGLPADILPEGVLVQDLSSMSSEIQKAPVGTLPPGVAPQPSDPFQRDITAAGAGAAFATPSPISYVPSNATGIMWVSGHLSIFAKVNGALTIRGFRGHQAYYLGEYLPGPMGEWFSQQLNLGVAGGFKNDALFPKLPGKQTVIYVATNQQTAQTFGENLNATQINETYKYSTPRPDAKPGGKEWRMHQMLQARGGEAMAVQCGNQCTTVPVEQMEAAVGTRPQIDTPAGRLDITTGRTEGGPVDPYAKGRASLTQKYFDNPDLSGAKPGATRIGMTKGAVGAIGVVRIGGGIWMVYGGIQSLGRLWDAFGTEDFAQVAAEEAASWAGGIGGAELGGAIAAGIGEKVLLITGGEVSAVFVLGGFGAALAAGYYGAKYAAGLVRAIIVAPNAMVYGTATFLEGFMDANAFAGTFVYDLLASAMLRPVVVSRAWVNPNNWDLRAMPAPAANAVRNLGLAAWSSLGSLDPDGFEAQAGKTLADLGVSREVAAQASKNLVPAGILDTADGLLMRTPLDFVQLLQRNKLLYFVQDPEVLADNEVNREGHKPDEAYINVRLRPLVAAHASINPNNWDLGSVGPGADDVRQVGQKVWAQLGTLKKEQFDTAREQPLSAFGIPWPLMRAATKAILKPSTGTWTPAPGETAPDELIDEQAQEYYKLTPEEFVNQVSVHAGLRFRADPGAISNAAVLWLRAGYQPW